MSRSQVRKWMIFDGPIDSSWLENMNTVLDDNKKLCLNSGEVIAMMPTMSVIFEVVDLSKVSPSTISRCGIVYMPTSSISWRFFVESWLNKILDRPYEEFKMNMPLIKRVYDEYMKTVMPTFEWLFPPLLNFIHKNCHHEVSAGVLHSVRQTIVIIDMHITNTLLDNIRLKRFENITEFFRTWLSSAIIFGVTLGFGSTLTLDSRIKFDSYFRSLLIGEIKAYPVPDFLKKLFIPRPIGLIEDYVFNFRQAGFWTHWDDVIKNKYYNPEPEINIHQMLIPSVESMKYHNLLEKHITYNHQFLLMGERGTGKTLYFDYFLNRKLPLEKYSPVTVSLRVNTTTSLAQELILSKLVNRGAYSCGAPRGKIAILFLDDLNLPHLDNYGVNQVQELIRTFLDHGYWYSMKDHKRLNFEKILLVASMGKTGGCFQKACPRLLRHFSVFVANTFSDKSLSRIFGTLIRIGYKKCGMPPDIIASLDNIMEATIHVYRICVKYLRPTPNKTHYWFNMRDLGRVASGMLLFSERILNENHHTEIYWLWTHEMMRVFSDRLVSRKDHLFFFNLLRDVVKTHICHSFDGLFKPFAAWHVINEIHAETPEVNEVTDNEIDHHEQKEKEIEVRPVDFRGLLYGMEIENRKSNERYMRIASIDEYKDLIEEVAKQCKDSCSRNCTNLLMFRYAVEHVCHIVRILSVPHGCGLLISVSGSGRFSLSVLAAHICNQRIIMPEFNKNYGTDQWREVLRRIMMSCGIRNVPTVIISGEKQMFHEFFLQDMDNLLNGAEVPHVFSSEEIQKILRKCRLSAQGGFRAVDVDPLSVHQFFKNNCRRNIHALFCSRLNSVEFRKLILLYPSLVNCCTIDWFENWPTDALEAIASIYLKDVGISQDMKGKIIKVCPYIHLTARELSNIYYSKTGLRCLVTNQSYLNLVRTIVQLGDDRRAQMKLMREKYFRALMGLKYANEQAIYMKEMLLILRPEAVAVAEESAKISKEIRKEIEQIKVAINVVQAEEIVTNEKLLVAKKMTLQCELELVQLKPINKEINEAIEVLKPKELNYFRNVRNPSELVKKAVEGLCILLDIKPEKVIETMTAKKKWDFWVPGIRAMLDPNFNKRLKDFDKDHIHPKFLETLRKQILSIKEFDPKVVKKISRPAEALCRWVVCIDKYDLVMKAVAPKLAEAEKAREIAKEAQHTLKEHKKTVKEYERKIHEMKERIVYLEARKHKVDVKITSFIQKSDRAVKIAGSLDEEKSGWDKYFKRYKRKYRNVDGDSVLSSAFITYLGLFPKPYREVIVNYWRKKFKNSKILCDSRYNFVKVAGDDVTIYQWFAGQLPQYDLAIENAIIALHSVRWPLFIDPQSQANTWIRSYYSDRKLGCVKIRKSEPYFDKLINILLTAIPDGNIVLLENIQEDFDTVLDPLLLKDTFMNGEIRSMKIAGNVLKYHNDFRFFMTTKLQKPYFIEHIVNKVILIDFTMTKKGMEYVFQTAAVFNTMPSLERKRNSMITNKAQNMSYYKKLQNRIIDAMYKMKKRILDDSKLVRIINDTKKLCVQVKEKQILCKAAEKELARLRSNFLALSIFCRILFECMTDLRYVCHMYQYSLSFYRILYAATIRKILSKPTRTNWTVVQTRIIEKFAIVVHHYVTRGIFRKDRVLFSFLVSMKVLINNSFIQQSEVTFLLKGAPDFTNNVPLPAVEWLLEDGWDALCYLQQRYSSFKGITQHFLDNVDRWRRFWDTPITDQVPSPYNRQLNPFQKLILVRVLRPDMFIHAVREFVTHYMLGIYASGRPLSWYTCYREYSKSSTPILIITQPEIDPLIKIRMLIRKLKIEENKLKVISIGAGDGEFLDKAIEVAKDEGMWVVLLNCHLASSHLDKVNKLLDLITETHRKFRLVITCLPTDSFPEKLLTRSMKIADEGPVGLKANVVRTFNSQLVSNEKFYNSCGIKNRAFGRLLFGLSFFHATCMQRKKYENFGWNNPYRFNYSDFELSAVQLQKLLTVYDDIPFNAIFYMIGECNYGGKIVEEYDRRTLYSVLIRYINRKVTQRKDHELFKLTHDTDYPNIMLEKKYRSHSYYLSLIWQMPYYYPIELTGLHENADIELDLHLSKELIAKLVAVQPSGYVKKTDELVLSRAEIILSKLPKEFNVRKAMEKKKSEYHEPMTPILINEMTRYNNLLVVIKSSLYKLRDVLTGRLILSEEDEIFCNSIASNQIPTTWRKAMYPTVKRISSFISDLEERLAFITEWHTYGNPIAYWISGFFYPQALAGGVIQDFGRTRKITLEKVALDHIVLDDMRATDRPPMGAYIYGLYIEGAHWNTNLKRLDEQLPKVLTELMPVIWLLPLQGEMVSKTKFLCPVYQTRERARDVTLRGSMANYVFGVFLNSEQSALYWSERSVALICQPEDENLQYR